MNTHHLPSTGSYSMKTLLLAFSGLMVAVPTQLNADPVNFLTFIPSASNPKVSGDGRFVAFESAEALVFWDTNGASDIYRLEIATGAVLLASWGNNGLATARNVVANSTNSSISADGNIITFQSVADNLVDGDTNGDFNPQGGSDVFVVNFNENTINRVSERLLGGGNFEEGNWNSENASISADGSLIAFSTGATNLAPDADTGDYTVYVYNNNDGSLVAVPVPDGITPADFVFCDFPAISGNGRFVAFEFEVVDSVSNPPAYNYSEVYRFDLADGSLIRIGVPVNGGRVNSPSISADGRFTGFDTNFDIDDNDNNDGNDVYKYDAATDTFVWISRDGESDALTVSGDGNSNLWNDRDFNVVKMTDQGLTTSFGQGRFSSISFDGNIVAFETGGGITVAQDAAFVPLPPVTLTPAPVQPPVAQPVAAPATAPVSKPIAKPVAKPAPIPVANQTPSTKPSTKPPAPAPVVNPAVAAKAAADKAAAAKAAADKAAADKAAADKVAADKAAARQAKDAECARLTALVKKAKKAFQKKKTSANKKKLKKATDKLKICLAQRAAL